MNFGLKRNYTCERNASTVDLPTSEDCAVGFSITSTIAFLFLSALCGTAALGGNLALLVAIFRMDSLHQRGGVFITSLAVADLLVGIAMIPLYIYYAIVSDDMESYWLIKIEGFLWIVTVTATTYSLSAVSIDRLISVVSPLRYHQILPEKRCHFIISLIWFGSIILASPRLVIDDFVQLEKLWITCSVATVAIPFLIMVLSYSKIFAEVKRQNRSAADDIMASSQAHVERAGNRKAAVTIGIVVGLFVLTFTPSAVVYFLLLFEEDECKELKLNDAWLWVALVSFFHSSCNPWVYGLRSREVRSAMKKLVNLRENSQHLTNYAN